LESIVAAQLNQAIADSGKMDLKNGKLNPSDFCLAAIQWAEVLAFASVPGSTVSDSIDGSPWLLEVSPPEHATTKPFPYLIIMND
jgi:hypothetical protein